MLHPAPPSSKSENLKLALTALPVAAMAGRVGGDALSTMGVGQPPRQGSGAAAGATGGQADHVSTPRTVTIASFKVRGRGARTHAFIGTGAYTLGEAPL